MPVKSASRSRELVAILVTSLVMIGGYMFCQSNLVQDWWKGMTYEEGSDIGEIRKSLQLTSKGERIFLATQPLIEDAEAFNEHCDSHVVEVSLLGCYVGDRIYIYEINLTELQDSNKVTAAHELLHAVWDRLSTRERDEVTQLLQQIELENTDWVETELSLYEEKERIEELYTRVGTKLREIPADLERHYQEYFLDRGKIIDFYESYQQPFRQLQAECEVLRSQIEQLNQEIERDRSEYLGRVDAFDARVVEFNLCADMQGCFRSPEDFQSQRSLLEIERIALNQLREDLNAKIDENNANVVKYQERQRDLGKLNNALNSNIEKLERSINE